MTGDATLPDIAAAGAIDLELIRRFLAVAEELNFTRAAARLGLAQPPLSAAIDLAPSEVVAAWPDTSRSRAVAGFVRAAIEVAVSHTGQSAALIG